MSTSDSGGFLPIDWRVAFGLSVTLLWISTGLLYLLQVVGWGNFVHLPTADIGSFLEGAFAPLAFSVAGDWPLHAAKRNNGKHQSDLHSGTKRPPT